MTFRNFKWLPLLALLCYTAQGRADDLSIDDSFSTPPPATTDSGDLSLDTPTAVSQPTEMPSATPLDSIDTATEMSPEDNLASAQTTTESENVNLASPVEILQSENALYGISVGLVTSYQWLYENYKMKSIYGDENVDRELASIQSVGVVVRYAILPYYSLGTDVNISYTRSVNHNSVTYDNTKTMSEISTLKAELNFGYAVQLSKYLPIYFLAGIGAENTSGGSIENIVNSQGYGGQAGGGIVINSKLNLEGMYSYYFHRISQRIQDDYGKAAKSSQIEDVDSKRTINQGLVVRLLYSLD